MTKNGIRSRGRSVDESAELRKVNEEIVLPSSVPLLDPDAKLSNRLKNTVPLTDVAILVMGLTGAGKSTFISRLTQENVEIGHSLESCTTEVGGHVFHRANGQQVFLIDTPGFDDTHKDNVQVLQKIATFLCTIHQSGCLNLTGLIYLQRITDTRMSGSSLKSIRIIEKLCGKKNFANIVIVTTMWSILQTEEAERNGLERQVELKNKPEFFGNMIADGSVMTRHNDTYESAYDIVESIVERKKRVVLDVQKEMMNHGVLVETAVGQFLEGDYQRTRERYERELNEIQEALNEAMEEEDDDLITTILEQKRDYEERIHQSELGKSCLSVTYEQMSRSQSDLYNQRFDDEKEREVEPGQMSALEIELMEQLERTEMEHIRALNLLRREKKGQDEVIETQNKEFKMLRKRYEDQLRRERAEREAKEKGPKGFKALGSGLFHSVMREAMRATGLDIPQNTRRVDSFPLDNSSQWVVRSSNTKPTRSQHSSPTRRGTGRDSISSQQRSKRDRDVEYPSRSDQLTIPRRAATFAAQSSSMSPMVGTVYGSGNVRYDIITQPLGPTRNPAAPTTLAIKRSYKD